MGLMKLGGILTLTAAVVMTGCAAAPSDAEACATFRTAYSASAGGIAGMDRYSVVAKLEPPMKSGVKSAELRASYMRMQDARDADPLVWTAAADSFGLACGVLKMPSESPTAHSA